MKIKITTHVLYSAVKFKRKQIHCFKMGVFQDKLASMVNGGFAAIILASIFKQN